MDIPVGAGIASQQDLFSPLPIFVYRPRSSFHGPLNVPLSPLVIQSAVVSSKLIFGSEMRRQRPVGFCALPLAHDAREAESKTNVILHSSQLLGNVGLKPLPPPFTSWRVSVSSTMAENYTRVMGPVNLR